MSPRRKSAEEVRVEIKDSEPRSKSYWNLRGQEKIDCVNEISDDLKELNNEIKIQFRLNESKELTEGQKKTILKTLLKDQQTKEEIRDNGNYSDQTFDKRVLLVLLIFLSGLGFAFLLVSITFY